MKKAINLLMMCAAMIAIGSATVAAQTKAPDYKIKNIKIVPYDSATGKFDEELKPGDGRSFFNDLSISLFVVFEIEGEAGSFEAGRKLQMTVKEGTKIKASKTEQIGLIGSDGIWFEPLWLYPAMCSDVTITAKIIGQRIPGKAVTRKIPFLCGE